MKAAYLAAVNTPSLNLENNISLTSNMQTLGPQVVGDLLVIERTDNGLHLLWLDLWVGQQRSTDSLQLESVFIFQPVGLRWYGDSAITEKGKDVRQSWRW